MAATRDELYDMLNTVFAFTRLSNINQSLPRPFSNGETLYISEIYFLHLIGSEKGRTVTELAGATFRTLSAASQIVTRLHRKGLVDKSASPRDRKVQRLTLTEKGRQMLDEHLADDACYYDDILSALGEFSSGDVQQVKHLIDVLTGKTLEAIQSKKQK